MGFFFPQNFLIISEFSKQCEIINPLRPWLGLGPGLHSERGVYTNSQFKSAMMRANEPNLPLKHIIDPLIHIGDTVMFGQPRQKPD